MSTKKIIHFSWDELDRDALTNSKHFEGGQPMTDISAWAKKMVEKDPDGKKADAIVEKYRSKK